MKRTPKELGVTGLKHAGNILLDDEVQENIRFPYSIKTYSKMKSDPLISGSLTLIKQFMKKVSFDIEAKGGVEATELAKQRRDAIYKALFEDMDRSFSQVVTDVITFIENGFSFHEPTYRIKDGMITWKDFPSRYASTIKGFKWDTHTGAITHVIQWRPTDMSYTSTSMTGSEIIIPYDKLLHFRADSERNNPIGRSILKNAYRAWYYKQNLEEIEAIGMERDISGIPYLKVPSEFMMADEEEDPEKFAQFQSFVRIVSQMRNNEQDGLILPSDRDESGNLLFEATLLSSSSSRVNDTGKIIERYDYRITQSMLTDFIMMGAGSSGSFALSDNKVNTFIQSLEANIEVIAEQFNRKAIPKLFELNGWDKKDLPTLTYRPISSATLTELGEFLDKAGSFLTPDEGLEKYIRGEAGAPERDAKNLYLDNPVNVHQAQSQRTGMEASASKATETTQDSDNDVDQLAEEVSKGLRDNYRGEA